MSSPGRHKPSLEAPRATSMSRDGPGKTPGTPIDGEAFLLEDKDVVEIAGVRMELIIRP